MKPFVKMETKFEPIKSNWTIIRVSYFDLVFSALNVAKKRKIRDQYPEGVPMGTKFQNGREPIAVLYDTYNSFPLVLS